MSGRDFEDNLALLRRAREGDETAREELVNNNIALVKSLLRGFLGRGTDYDDLLQIGSIGLLKAIEGYDESFGVKFSTYAVPMITGEIKRFLRDDGMVKVSRRLKEDAIKLARASSALKAKLLREPTLSELSAATGLTPEDAALALEACQEPVSFDVPISEEDGASMLERLPAPEDENFIDRLMLKDLLSVLSAKERQIIMLRFFMDKTQSEIAGMLGVSQVQVSRILKRTLDKLKEKAE